MHSCEGSLLLLWWVVCGGRICRGPVKAGQCLSADQRQSQLTGSPVCAAPLLFLEKSTFRKAQLAILELPESF